MDMKTLRRRCAARIRDLPIQTPFDIQIFTAVLAERRGRPIALHPMPLHGEPFGAWFAEPSVDVVFYEQRTTSLHQRHIILHELGHILCGHRGIDGVTLAALLSGDGAATEHSRAALTGCTIDAEEGEAEMIATLILARVSGAQAHTATADPHVVATLRLLDTLQGASDGP